MFLTFQDSSKYPSLSALLHYEDFKGSFKGRLEKKGVHKEKMRFRPKKYFFISHSLIALELI